MRKRRGGGSLLPRMIALPPVFIGILLLFITALNDVSSAQSGEARRLLEESLLRAVTVCYAADGSYPPTLEELCRRCGIQIDEDRFAVYYDCFAENLRPDITVLDREYEKASDATT